MDEDVDSVGVKVGDAVAAGDALDASCSVIVVIHLILKVDQIPLLANFYLANS